MSQTSGDNLVVITDLFQTQMIQHPQQAKTMDVRQGCPDPCATTTPLMGRTLPPAGSSMQQQIGAAGVASSLQPSRQTAPVGLHHQAAASRAMQQQQQQQQQLSPSAQQAVAFAMGLPGTTSQFAQMQQQYLEQMYRSSMFQNGLLQGVLLGHWREGTSVFPGLLGACFSLRNFYFFF